MGLKSIKIGVLAGGVSQERDISLDSGKHVFEALIQNGFKASFLDLNSANPKEVKKVLRQEKINLAFLALHGCFGEDGQIQAILESMPLAYTGSRPKAALLSMDKAASKVMFKKHRINTPQFYLAKKTEAKIAGLSFPVVVKPSSCGSSLGVSIVKNKTALAKALKKASGFGGQTIIEQYIEGREFTVGILGKKALAVVEIIPKQGFFNFKNKYTAKKSVYLAPARLKPRLYQKIQKMALAAHSCLGCRDFSRVDFKLRGDSPYVLEVNSIPGLTARSLFPLSARASNISFSQFIKALLLSASRRKKC